MKSSTRLVGIIAASAVLILPALVLGDHTLEALAQQPTMPSNEQVPDMLQHHRQMMQTLHEDAGEAESITPTLPGQDAFGAIQEVVRILESDPKTDWSKVNLEALRQHLIDMNEVTLRADAVAKPIEGGAEITVTGDQRTEAAIKRMLPAHAQELSQLNGWSAKTDAPSRYGQGRVRAFPLEPSC
jgi:hypothetical protein